MVNKLDLSGEWLLCLDKECKGTDLVFDDTINLPNTTSNAKKGEYNTESLFLSQYCIRLF